MKYNLDLEVHNLGERLDATENAVKQTAGSPVPLPSAVIKGRPPKLSKPITSFAFAGRDVSQSYSYASPIVRIRSGAVYGPGGKKFTEEAPSASGVTKSGVYYLFNMGSIGADVYAWAKIEIAEEKWQLISTSSDDLSGQSFYDDDNVVAVPLVFIAWSGGKLDTDKFKQFHYGDIVLDGGGEPTDLPEAETRWASSVTDPGPYTTTPQTLEAGAIWVPTLTFEPAVPESPPDPAIPAKYVLTNRQVCLPLT
jgi:hypothetical protein